MHCFDVFNGDADGICALVQLRLAEPRPAKLVTGVKRDIKLLERVQAKAGDALSVLDISLRTNADALARILEAGASVFYVDHHNPSVIPKHENLIAVIETRADMCTALLVNACLEGAHEDWAIVAAFGDNLTTVATCLAKQAGWSKARTDRARQLGELLNYNAYGRTVADLHFTPQTLYRTCLEARTPESFITTHAAMFSTLEQGYRDDLDKARSSPELAKGVLMLADAAWARRISGTFGNVLAKSEPEQAHAILTPNEKDGYTVSVRAPLDRPGGADQLCLQFPTGGGRTAAAGINHLPEDRLEDFLSAFARAF